MHADAPAVTMAHQRVGLTLSESPAPDESRQPGHAVVEVLLQPGEAAGLMPHLRDKHRLVKRLLDAKLFHGCSNMREPARGKHVADASCTLELFNVHAGTSLS